MPNTKPTKRLPSHAALVAFSVSVLLSLPSAQTPYQPVLAGTTGELRWALFDTDDTLQKVKASVQRDLVLVANPVGNVIGVRYEDAELIWVSRIPAQRYDQRIPAEGISSFWLFHSYEADFLRQGYRVVDASRSVGPGFARARYQKGDMSIEFLLHQEAQNLWRFRLNLLDAMR
ncbi:hypothetical protein [Deinococcus peraridilitoris]|uniref:Uncharacterized protein n=1 Tax=Deinococcus peraridilitoris (strain DSM 19664 / LMG 22246 / CIP 109416 / KR-200) TaxID=937777 RepID=L0A6P5_DEIPD|nr:hypothetical protein [Deinococcus peraridilitoris]AFZ69553.1 hypothetical protein Deipe_4189 [Deinococcus peraridilitoris DSM 19664]